MTKMSEVTWAEGPLYTESDSDRQQRPKLFYSTTRRKKLKDENQGGCGGWGGDHGGGWGFWGGGGAVVGGGFGAGGGWRLWRGWGGGRGVGGGPGCLAAPRVICNPRFRPRLERAGGDFSQTFGHKGAAGLSGDFPGVIDGGSNFPQNVKKKNKMY